MGRPATVAPFAMDLNLVRLELPLSAGFNAGPLLCGSGAAFEAALCRSAGAAEPAADCRCCRRRDHCTAGLLRARSLSSDPDLVRRHQRPGLPYLFSPAESLSALRLTLLGPACDHAGLLLTACGAVASTGTGLPLALDYQNQSLPLHMSPDGRYDNLPLLSMAVLLDLQSPRFAGCRLIRTTLRSPLRLRHEGRELQRFDQTVMIRSCLRRLSSLAAYYGTAGDDELIRSLAGLAAQVRLHRVVDSGRDERLLRGVTGSYLLYGPFDELGPYLALASFFNLGKGAAYGMGCFTVTPLD